MFNCLHIATTFATRGIIPSPLIQGRGTSSRITLHSVQLRPGRSTPGVLVEESLMIRAQEGCLDHSSLQDAVLCCAAVTLPLETQP